MIATITYLLFIACVILQCGFWLLGFGRLAVYRDKSTLVQEDVPVSIVICAFNEEDNIKRHLPLILAQDYPHYEVLLVDDASTDDSPEILQAFAKAHPQLRVLRLDYPEGKKNAGKKNALAQGIQAAKHDILLLTDADCWPASDQWLRRMASAMGNGVEICLGYGPQQYRLGLLNAFIRYETIYTAIQYMSFALWRLPYMGVGRNLVYKKELFARAGGFGSHEHIASGDDDLFVNQIASGDNTRIVTKQEAFMYSEAKGTWEAYFRQKSRHVTTGKHYQPLHQAILGLLSASHFGLYFFAALSVTLKISTVFVVSLLGIAVLIKAAVFAVIAKQLKDLRIIPLIPLLDVLYLAYYIILAPSLMWGKTGTWK